MKNIFKILLALIAVFLFGVISVSAGTNDTTLVKNTYNNIYGVYEGSDRVHLFYAQRYTMNGITAYCIEPVVPIDTNIYSSTTNTGLAGYSDEVMNYIKLVAYYGYDNPNHNTMNYYLASQDLMWEKINGKTTKWVTGLDVNGPEIDVSKEKNEIISLINNHNNVPSFNGQSFEVNIGEEKEIIDAKNLLTEYEVSKSGNIKTVINGNTLKIVGTDNRSTQEIILNKKSYTDRVVLLYHSGSNQKLLSSGKIDMPTSKVTINTVGGSIEINKVDKDTGTIPQGEATLNGAKYGIYDINNKLVDTLITGSKNKSKDLPYGNYYLKEIEASEGYELDTNIYNFSLNSKSIDINMEVVEKVIEREIELTKVYASNETKIMSPEVGIKFGFYNKGGEELAIKETDSNGKINIVLPYGTYTVKQLSTTQGYEKVEDFNIVIKESGEKFYYTISNAEVDARLKIIKIDEDTKEIITKANTTFKIKNLETGEYIKQKVTYPEVVIYEEFKTDENGWLITPYPLLSGKYLIEEITVPNGYAINKDGVEFSIDENTEILEDELIGEYIEIQFGDQEVLGTIEITKKGDMLTGIDENRNFIFGSKTLTNVEFEVYANEDIYSANGKLIHTKGDLVEKIITNEAGIAKTSKLHLGKYCLKEVKTLDGYKLDNELHCYDLKYKDQYTEIIEVKDSLFNEYKSVELSLLKHGQVFSKIEDGKTLYEYVALPNVEFGLYANEDIYSEDGNLLIEKDELIKIYKTDVEGKINLIGKLPFNSYYIKEISTTNNYILDGKQYEFSVNRNSENVEKIELKINGGNPILNDIKKGNLIITKVDSEGNKLSGVEFIIYAEDKTTVIYKGVTNAKGIIDLELPYGKYYYQETKALEGYQLDDTLYEIEINEENQDINVEMDNKLIPIPNTGINYNLLYFPIALIGAGIGIYFIFKRKGRKNVN